jgi:hypothetical protein
VCFAPPCQHPTQPPRVEILRQVDMNKLRNRTSNIWPSRISLPFTSKLISTAENDGPRKSSSSTKLQKSPLNAAPRYSKEISASTSLEQDFHSAALAEPPTEPYLIKENKYPSIRALRTDSDIGDGVWICCHCRHENILRHYKGAHPFKHLCCARCNRILCSFCHTSEILSPLAYGLIHAPRPAGDREVRYCHVCSNCGLSHRAEMVGTTLDFYGVVCAGCGISSYGDWPRFHIGDNEPYRRDPDASFAKLIERRADDAARLAFHWDISPESRPTSRLSCRNPDDTT